MAGSIKEQWERQQADQLAGLLEWAGDIATLARLAGVSASVVHGWVKRGRVSVTAAVELERVSGGAFKKSAIRPDVVEWWGDER